ncbi:hypothetical protein Sjap_010044 [Stephania japonica]|uniref:Laccase n=1 Tax=Stephania japonica TaxID=461633 RepID=A0AAP0JAW7_9MAGN
MESINTIVLGLLVFLTTCLASLVDAEVHYHNFVIQSTPVKRLCRTKNIITVNGQFPGPTIEARNGDTLVIKAVNQAQYPITLHWHGIHQRRTAWADGPDHITQCPIQPGGSYTYRFTIIDQEGTLWWHAHASWLRATVYGALIIYPRQGSSYPFTKPHREIPILLGEWWYANPVDILNNALMAGAAPNVSDAYTINGQPGDLYNCSSQDTVIVPVKQGETNLIRLVGSTMNQELFFGIAKHKLTVVAIDSSYTKPYTTDVVVVTPGQTLDLLVTADQAPSRYYIAARAYASAPSSVPFDNTTTTAVLEYQSPNLPCRAASKDCSGGGAASPKPQLPSLPAYSDTSAVTRFTSGLRSPQKLNPITVPKSVDHNLFFTVGLGLRPCQRGRRCGGPNGQNFTASMNNVSFVLPTNYSILQANYQNINGVFSSNFPPNPPLKFDYTGKVPRKYWTPKRGTEALRLKFGSRVQLVLQDTSIFAAENHPIHLHGHNFFVVAEGFGNFNARKDSRKFNLVDPPQRNTVGVPVGGWAVIRFTADNPGVWLMHCHFDNHLFWGLAMVFVTDNGVGELETIEPPPNDLPRCS